MRIPLNWKLAAFRNSNLRKHCVCEGMRVFIQPLQRLSRFAFLKGVRKFKKKDSDSITTVLVVYTAEIFSFRS